MRAVCFLGLALIAACELPPMSLRFTLTDGDAQQCFSDIGNATTKCDEVTMVCDAVLSLRVIPPSDPEFPYMSVCEPLRRFGGGTLCSIASVELPQPATPIPEQVLEVQMAIFADEAPNPLPRDESGAPICPRVQFGANNLPIAAQEPCTNPTDPTSCPAMPAVGGRVFYYPGDEKTVVKLGCTNLELLTGATCTGMNDLRVTATVNDFETAVSVSPGVADTLFVAIGEPVLDMFGNHFIKPMDLHPLSKTIASPVPGWSTTLESSFQGSYCLEVLESAPESTRALTCTNDLSNLDAIDILGYRLSRTTLQQILAALGRTTFPDQGLVVGIVLDHFLPVAGATVTTDGGTVKYLSADRTSIITTGTSSNGIFISEDALYGAQFFWSGDVAFGGRVLGRVTIVVLEKTISPE